MALPPSCSHAVATYYNVPETIIETVIAHSSGRGIGLMGIDSGWLPFLEQAGFNEEKIRNDVCVNIAAGAWILAWCNMSANAHRAAPPTRKPPLPPPSSTLSNDLKSCAMTAARRYHLHEQLFLAVLETEGGRAGETVRNRDGSYDMGPAQINSIHLPELSRLGITREQVINDGCLNVHIGAWILARELGNETPQHPKEFWQRIGNYNSRTPEYNQAYQLKVWKHVISLPHSQPNG